MTDRAADGEGWPRRWREAGRTSQECRMRNAGQGEVRQASQARSEAGGSRLREVRHMGAVSKRHLESETGTIVSPYKGMLQGRVLEVIDKLPTPRASQCAPRLGA